MYEQIELYDYCKQLRDFGYYEHKCQYCYWGSDEKTCKWSDKADRPTYYHECHDRSRWAPSCTDIPRLCGNCKYSNQFEYKIKPEYEEEVKKHNGYTRKAADDPVEEPNIYCTRNGGSINRKRPFMIFTEPGFGIGLWHRQHEWDTCDGWELDQEWYGKMYEQLKEAEIKWTDTWMNS